MSASPARLLAALMATTALIGVGQAVAQSLPTGAEVASGAVAIGAPANGALTITQSSGNAIVNWQSFSIGQGNRVDIVQPNSQSAILNRVAGGTPSTIAGSLSANGQVFLVNPNGVTITGTGQVRAAGFTASSLGISDEDFKAGMLRFQGSGASARVANHGEITIERGGYAALIGGSVENSGTITAPTGRVGLGSGERATLDLAGDGFLQVAMPTNAEGDGALVKHSGSISANGGSVTLTAAAARNMARQAVNLSGHVEARSVSGRNGSITLSGGDGTVAASGKLDVSSRDGRGGSIAVTGRSVALTGARLDATGKTGGGQVRVGGDRQGSGTLQRAETTTIDASTRIAADATERGTGGNVTVWSDKLTTFAGTISAKGGAVSGNGGEVEVSGKALLDYTGITDLTAANGAFGTLLLDPYNVIISSGADTGGFTASGNDSVINASTLNDALSTANVVVSTGSAGAQAGDITVTAPLSWSTSATLSLQAAGAISLDAPITAGAGGLTLSSGGTISATGAVFVARFTLASGNWVQNTATLPGFAAGDFQVTGGSFLRAAGGVGTGADPYLLTDIYGVQGMGTSTALRAASYRLSNDVDATGTAAWSGGAGFNPIGDNANSFTGSLDGAGHTIGGLAIARPSLNYVGLIGALGTVGTVSNIGLLGGSISGNTFVGGLVGDSGGGATISQAYAIGSVSGTTNVGGLVGYHVSGSISQAYAAGSVSGTTNVGGLVGRRNSGTLTNTYWDTQTSGRSVGVGVGITTGAMGRTTAQMQDLASFSTTYAGFDFASVWSPPNQAGQGGLATAYYPQLYSLSRVLAVTPTTSRSYGDANPALVASYAGLRAGDVVTTLGTLTTGASPTSDVGAYAATASGTAVTSSAGSYRIVHVPGTLTVTARPLTVTADAQSRSYGDANPGLTYTTSSLGAGAALSGLLTTSATAASDVGTYAITAGTLTAGANPNYALTYQGANLTVGQRAVTVTADAQSRSYGDANSTLTYVASSLGAGSALSGSLATSATASSDVGTYAITVGTLTAGANPNYALTYQGANLTVGQRAVTVTADAQSRSYGDANPTLTYVASSLGAGSALSGSLATSATASSDVGTYAITAGTLTAGANPNYALTYAGANLTVGQRAVTVTADAQSRSYGDANPGLTYTTSSLGAGAALSGLLTTSATAASDVGTYAITAGTLTAGANPNYALTYQGANLTVGQRAVTVTADAQSRSYGDANPGLTYTTSSLGAGAALSGLLTTSATAASDVGTYAITAGTLTAGANPNYALTYQGANLTVGQRAVTVTADAQSRVYGDANPALSYTVGGAGLVDGDTLSGGLFSSADATSLAGSYAITQGSLRASANYSLAFRPGFLTVTGAVGSPPNTGASMPNAGESTPTTAFVRAPPSAFLTSAAVQDWRMNRVLIAADAGADTGTIELSEGGRSPGDRLTLKDPRFDQVFVCPQVRAGCVALQPASAPGPQAGR